jgi:stage II sporulation protein D
MRKLVIGVCLICLVSSCAAPRGGGRFASSSAKEPRIRVLLGEGDGSYRVAASKGLRVKSEDGMEIVGSSDKSTVFVEARGTSLQFSIEPDGSVGAVEGVAIIEPTSKSVLTFDGVRYPGSIRVLSAGGGTMSLINILPIERYLEGVLPHEIGDPGPDGYDAVKSQAVAARTYAMGKIDMHKDDHFDVYASVMDQVYRGLEGTTKVASSAVGDTRGRVVDYRGKTVLAYYSACCGGHTSDIRLVWPEREPADYLHGVPDRTTSEEKAFCREYRRFRWRYNFTGRQMGEILRVTIPRESGVSEEDVGALKNMHIEKRSHSGRVIKLLIETTKDTFVVEGDRIRWVLELDPPDGRILPSCMFRLDKVMERDRIAFVSISGGGNGHGVGMCQNGSIGMARKGYTYTMILKHYYPGSTVEKAY